METHVPGLRAVFTSSQCSLSKRDEYFRLCQKQTGDLVKGAQTDRTSRHGTYVKADERGTDASVVILRD